MEQMRPGDIAIFEAGDDWIGKSIALLTKSHVSHAAMVYGENTIVEMGSSGIQVNAFRQDAAGEKAYLLRLKAEPDPAPLVEAARKYVKSGVRYDFPDLVILAGLIIYREIRPTPRWKKITDLILSVAAQELDYLLNLLIQRGGPAMVCSQLVYQCYWDCGRDYRITLRSALLENAGANGPARRADTVCLADLTRDMDAPQPYYAQRMQIRQGRNEALARELYESLVEADEAPLLEERLLCETVGKASVFLDLIEKILEQSGFDLPIPALFVAPSDILDKSENLRQYGTTSLLRVRG